MMIYKDELCDMQGQGQGGMGRVRWLTRYGSSRVGSDTRKTKRKRKSKSKSKSKSKGVNEIGLDGR